jgi:anti-sigma B factor antagonist
MQLKTTYNTTYLTIAPQGELDANSSIQLDELLTKVLSQDNVNIHIHCAGISYISSAGLGVFISYLDELQQRGGLFVFSNVSEAVADVMDLLGLNQLITVVETTAEAAAIFNNHSAQ